MIPTNKPSLAVSHQRPDIEFICRSYSAICVPLNFENSDHAKILFMSKASLCLIITRCYFPLVPAQLLLCILVTVCKYSVMLVACSLRANCCPVPAPRISRWQSGAANFAPTTLPPSSSCHACADTGPGASRLDRVEFPAKKQIHRVRVGTGGEGETVTAVTRHVPAPCTSFRECCQQRGI